MRRVNEMKEIVKEQKRAARQAADEAEKITEISEP